MTDILIDLTAHNAFLQWLQEVVGQKSQICITSVVVVVKTIDVSYRKLQKINT